MDRLIKRYGWIPDLPDARDYRYAAPQSVLATLPPQVDLRPQCPPVLDQGALGSCTAQAITTAHLFNQQKQGAVACVLPSRLFLYYNERVMEGTVAVDAGAMIRDGIKSLAQQGACPEPQWPYVIAKFAHKPPLRCYRSALKHQALTYQRLVQTLTQLKGCLASGYPFVFGFAVYESFDSSQVGQTGIVPLPSTQEQLLGGHAVLAVGYDDVTQRFLVMNSWGTGWGMDGFFTMPYAYLTERGLSSDFWTVRLVET